MSNSLNRKARRNQAKKLGTIKDVERLKQEITNESAKKINNGIISAMLLAMNIECKIGPQRAAKIVAKANELLDNYSVDAITKMAHDKNLR
jgi:hypothetical protein